VGFQKGHKLSQGRPPGSLSKRSEAFLDTLSKAGINPVEVLIEGLNNAREGFKNSIPEDMVTWNAQIINTAEKILPYVFPKLSSIEVMDVGEFANMTDAQKLETLKKAIPILESKIKQVGE
jgi:hypothetical protein